MTDAIKIRKWPKVFLFGDSITQQSFSPEGCWGSLLADHLSRRCDVINRGFSGYNVRFCKYLLPSLLDSQTAEDTVAITIFLGANDSSDGSLNPRQHTPLEEYKQGLKEMIMFAMSKGVSRDKIILIAPPPVYVPDWAEECKKKGSAQSHDNKVTALYAKACLETAEEMGTKKLDVYSEMMKEEDYQKYLRDGLHFSAAGSRLMFTLLCPLVDQLTSHLPQVFFPAWDQIDLDNISGSLHNF